MEQHGPQQHQPRPQQNHAPQGTRQARSDSRSKAFNFDKSLRSTKLSVRNIRDIDLLYQPLVNDGENEFRLITLGAMLAASPALLDCYVEDYLPDTQMVFDNLNNKAALWRQIETVYDF